MNNLTQVHGFNVSLYAIDRDTGYNFLMSESLECDYYQAMQAKKRLELEYPIDTNIVISDVIYLI